jgi:hypothetical protein
MPKWATKKWLILDTITGKCLIENGGTAFYMPYYCLGFKRYITKTAAIQAIQGLGLELGPWNVCTYIKAPKKNDLMRQIMNI